MTRPKQAVVVIHGVGEQRPMATLRSFVEAVLPDTLNSAQVKYRSKPDPMCESFELRCLQAPANRGLHRPITEFHEYYWAHHMRDSKYGSVLSWLFSLMLRFPWQMPAKLRPLYYLLYSGLLIVMAITLNLLLDQTNQSFVTSIYTKYELFLPLGVLVLQAIVGYIVIGYVADAARYLTPSPANIAARNEIRAEGIKLLRTLHESGKYFRIIVVGHSLGSIIGYDVIRHLWASLRESHVPKHMKQPLAKAFDAVAAHQQSLATAGPSDVEAFQQEQHKLWREHRAAGIPWLVTDFITIGSPLTYATMLMADNPRILEQRQIEFEFPCCPPVTVQPTHYQKCYESAPPASPISVRIPHHGAPFASTRWTNLFFPYRKGIFGDLIGGPLAGVFGKGIRDVPVSPAHDGFLSKTLCSHVCYWKRPKAAPEINMQHMSKTNSIKVIQAALRLDSLRSTEPWPEPTNFARKV